MNSLVATRKRSASTDNDSLITEKKHHPVIDGTNDENKNHNIGRKRTDSSSIHNEYNLSKRTRFNDPSINDCRSLQNTSDRLPSSTSSSSSSSSSLSTNGTRKRPSSSDRSPIIDITNCVSKRPKSTAPPLLPPLHRRKHRLEDDDEKKSDTLSEPALKSERLIHDQHRKSVPVASDNDSKELPLLERGSSIDNQILGRLHQERRARIIAHSSSFSGPHSILSQSPHSQSSEAAINSPPSPPTSSIESPRYQPFHRLDELELTNGESSHNDSNEASWCLSPPRPSRYHLSSSPHRLISSPIVADDGMDIDKKSRVRQSWQHWHEQQLSKMQFERSSSSNDSLSIRRSSDDGMDIEK